MPSRACCLRLDLPRGMSASSGSLCSLALDTSHTLLWSWCDNPFSVRWCLALDPRLKLRLTAEGLGAGLWRWSERTAVPIKPPLQKRHYRDGKRRAKATITSTPGVTGSDSHFSNLAGAAEAHDIGFDPLRPRQVLGIGV